MLFKKFEEEPKRKKRGTSLPFVIFRMCLSLIMLSIFSLAIYQAYKYFSGVDPLKLDPKTALYSAITSEGGVQLAKDILGFKASDVVGDLKQLAKNPGSAQTTHPSGTTTTPSNESNSPLLFRFAIVTDSHNDNTNLAKALKESKDAGAKFIVGMGDYTDVGTADEMSQAKKQFDAIGLPYYVTAGDHDLWDCRNRHQTPTCTFTPLFGSPYQSFSYSDVRFVILYNADNYDGMDGVEMAWLKDELNRIKSEHPKQLFVFMQEPLYHPSSDHFMGKETPKLQDQARQVREMLKDAGAGEVFAGDIHYFTQYSDPETNLKMTTVGAVTESRNAQHPRFALVDVHQDGSYNVADTEIK